MTAPSSNAVHDEGMRLRRKESVPEVSRRQLSAVAASRAIASKGCLLVRGFSSPHQVGLLKQTISDAFASYDANQLLPFVGHDGTPPRDFIRETGGVLAADVPSAIPTLTEAFEEVGVRALATEFFGEAPFLLTSKCTLRWVETKKTLENTPVTAIDFHQDGAFMGADVKTLNIWLALSECGENAPGLDLVPRRLSGVITHDDALTDWTVTDPVARDCAKPVSPLFHPGDALLFDHLMLHRTGLRPGMTEDRYAIETWLGAASAYPPGLNAVPY